MSGLSGQGTGVSPAGPGHSPRGGAASASPAKPSIPNAAPCAAQSLTGISGRVSIDRNVESADYRRGYAAGCAWYAAYIQRIADIRERHSAVLKIAIQKLPEFSAHWSPERRDQWFEWFFDLLEQASAIEARRAETPSGSVADESATRKGDAHD